MLQLCLVCLWLHLLEHTVWLCVFVVWLLKKASRTISIHHNLCQLPVIVLLNYSTVKKIRIPSVSLGFFARTTVECDFKWSRAAAAADKFYFWNCFICVHERHFHMLHCLVSPIHINPRRGVRLCIFLHYATHEWQCQLFESCGN